MKNALLIFAFLSFYSQFSTNCICRDTSSNKLTTGDGLANNSIRYMFPGQQKGFMWMGTVNGLKSYYDGNSFVSIYPTLICRFHWPTHASGIWKKTLTVFMDRHPLFFYIAVTI